jgi:citrate lyase subunit beta/citryl-CoA lyase
VFTPKPEAIARAKEIVAAFEQQPGAGVVGIAGLMYDRPHLTKALRLLGRAEAAGLAMK